jgi:hypothetical protein
MACHHVERRSPWSLPLVQICTVFRQKLNGIASSIIDRMVQRRIVVLIIIEPSCRPARPPDSSRIGQNRSRRVIFTVNERFWSAGKPGADVSRPSLSGRPRAGQSRITRLPLTSGRPLNRDFRFACPGWLRYTPDSRSARENLLHRASVQASKLVSFVLPAASCLQILKHGPLVPHQRVEVLASARECRPLHAAASWRMSETGGDNEATVTPGGGANPKSWP